MKEVSEDIKSLVATYQRWYSSLKTPPNVAVVHVDEVASKVAIFYEKIREVVEYREEHLMRRLAIERIIKRHFLLKGKKISAEAIVLELVRGGYFPNDKIPETKIQEVQKIVGRYLFVLKSAVIKNKGEKKHFFIWLLGLAACEIEESLASPVREKGLIELMENRLRGKIWIKGKKISKKEKELQLYIAIQRTLFKFDNTLIAYYLFKRTYPFWTQAAAPELTKISLEIYSFWKEVENALRHPLKEKFYKLCKKRAIFYLILDGVINEDPKNSLEILKDPKKLENYIALVYNKKLKSLKKKVKRAAIYATLSIFIGKVLLALAIEFPFDKYVIGKFNWLALAINIIVPPFLMFLLVSSIKPEKNHHLEKITLEVIKLVYKKDNEEKIIIVPPRKRGILMKTIIGLAYLLAFVISFGGIIWILNKLHFTILSIAIFLIFVSLIAFAGVKTRERAAELRAEEKKEPLFSLLIDFLALPIIQVGKWLSDQWTKYNIIVVFINLFIDVPIQVFVEFVEEWRRFLKEKREEIH